MNTEVMFSSATDLWETPQALFDELNAEFHFTLDVCALPENAKCKAYYTPQDNGLVQPWIYTKGAVWCNPPYGREIGKWVEKAYNSAKYGGGNCNALTGENRYKVVSRIHLQQSRDKIYQRSAEIRRSEKFGSVPFNDRNL